MGQREWEGRGREGEGKYVSLRAILSEHLSEDVADGCEDAALDYCFGDCGAVGLRCAGDGGGHFAVRCCGVYQTSLI